MNNSCNNDSEVYVNTTDGASKLANKLPSVRLECASSGSYVESSVSMNPKCEFNVSRIDMNPEKVIQNDSVHPKEAEPSPKNQIHTQGNEVEHSKEVCRGSKNSNEPSQVPYVIVRALPAEESVHCVKIELDDKSCTRLKQNTRSPCLISEMSGSNYRKLLSNPAGCAPVSNSKECLNSNKLESSNFLSPIPGFGLDLNALADTGIDTKSLNPPLDSEVVGRTQPNENACKSSISGEDSGFPQCSPNMKRKRSDGVGETDSCKRCNCKRSKCLKLYCECFTARVYCVGRCKCQVCFNKPAHEDIVLAARQQIESRNALAFSPKVIMCSKSPNCGDNELNKTPASARYIKGCNCKRSGCLKKYCECFQRGVGCSMSCKCGSCKNSFGRKEGNEGVVSQVAKIFTECASDVTLHDKLSKTDNENPAAYEHSNNSRDAPACESSFNSKYTDQHDVMHVARDKEPQDIETNFELENTRVEAEVEVEMKKEQRPTMMEKKEIMEMEHLNTLLGRERLSPAEERLKLRLIEKFYPN